eukprot:7714267-Ditylum_brightwellii.AAC.1
MRTMTAPNQDPTILDGGERGLEHPGVPNFLGVCTTFRLELTTIVQSKNKQCTGLIVASALG